MKCSQRSWRAASYQGSHLAGGREWWMEEYERNVRNVGERDKKVS